MIHPSRKFQFSKARRSFIRTAVLCAPFIIVLTLVPRVPGFTANEDVVTDGSPIGNYLAGRHAQVEEDFDTAIEFLTAALRKLPEIPDLLRRTFVLMIIQGRLDDAVSYAERLLEESPRAPIAHLLALVAAFKNGDVVKQADRLSAQPKYGLNAFSRPVLGAWSQLGAGEFNAALKTLEDLDGKDAAQGLHDMHKALILDFAGRKEDAEAAYTKLAKNKETRNFRLIQLYGNFLERIGKTVEARALYDQFARANPGTMLLLPAYARLRIRNKPKPLIASIADGAAEALFNIGNSLGEQRARETAVVLCRLALWLKPDFPIAQMMIADIFDGDQRYAQANQIYLNIDPKSPFRFSADLSRASNLNALEQLDAAIKLLEDMADRFASTPRPLIRLGNLMRRHERWEDAIVSYTEAIERVGTLTKRHWRMLYSRGIVLERAKRWPEAEKDFLRALDFEPNQPYVLNYLGYSWVDQGIHLKKALEMIRTAVHRRPNDGYIIDSLGWVYYRLGNYKKAVLELERAVQIRPEDPIINDHLGDAYWQVGRKLEAQFQWKRALGLNPDAEIEAVVRRKLEKGLLPKGHMGIPGNEADNNKNSDKT